MHHFCARSAATPLFIFTSTDPYRQIEGSLSIVPADAHVRKEQAGEPSDEPMGLW